MRVGIVLPTFHSDPARCLRLAEDAEAHGLDGVFLFDHLWHLGKKGRPALHGPTLMGAVLARTKRMVVGSLVARVGIQHDGVLAAMFSTMDRMGPGRVVAGLGIGDGLSREENEAFGIPFPKRPERLNQLIVTARILRQVGLPVWIGGSTPAMWQIAAAEADAVNLWNTPVAMTEEAAPHVSTAEVTWAGLDRRPEEGVSLSGHLAGLASAGTSWAIYAPLAGDDGLAGRLAAARQEASA
jgi:alkanesulfonate monooxygenase SsuD/methylene tetrahydromethanopterin reductase-like flavin-dependent oxidoreductase (luciferase family)